MAVLDRTAKSVLPLESGDRLTRAEFERRYAAMPEVKKAELIEGVVYMSSAVRAQQHGQPHGFMMAWLGVYASMTPRVMLLDNTTVRLDLDNEAQPDAMLRLPETAGGSSRLSHDDYVEGPPELIVEIAASSASYDLHDKFRVYRRTGVQEYMVWQIHENELHWFSLREGAYAPLASDDAGIISSQVFPGLRLSVEAMQQGELAAVLSTLQEGLNTGAHAAFVEKVGKKRKGERSK